jgi:MOSC domain-containing protein YiiM
VLRSLADGDVERMALAGDNLHVDLDLSEANLPAGTRLVAGDVVLEVTDEPHRPCRSFVERFGATGAKKVARANRTGKRGRGVMARVVRAGTIRVGDTLEVERRPGER